MALAVRIARWDPAQGKGVDDLFLAGHTPTLEVVTAASGEPAIGVDPAELEQIQSERDALQTDNRALRARMSDLADQLDRVEISGNHGAVQDLKRDIARERAKSTRIISVLKDTCLNYRDRVVGVLALEAAHAYPVPPTFGEEVPASEPLHVHMGQLEIQAGIAPKTASLSLKAVAQRGWLTRAVKHTDVERPDGVRERRTAVFIGPGDGAAQSSLQGGRRQADAERKARERDARLAREATLCAKVQELEQAQLEAQAHGCCLCGNDLLSTGYFCPACVIEHTSKDLAVRARRRAVDSTTQVAAAVALEPENDVIHDESATDPGSVFHNPITSIDRDVESTTCLCNLSAPPLHLRDDSPPIELVDPARPALLQWLPDRWYLTGDPSLF